MNKLSIIINLTVVISLNCKAQDSESSDRSIPSYNKISSSIDKNIKELTIGDEIPDLELNNIVNFRNNKSRISDFRGKILILDFWATWCAPCIESFTKLDSLQKKFENKLQILPITEEDDYKVFDFLSKMKRIKNISPPSVTEDKILNRLFKHSYIPHYIWINETGKIIAITGGENVNAQNIQSLIDGRNPTMPTKKDNSRKYYKKEDTPLIIPSAYVRKNEKMELEPLPQKDVVINSTLTKYVNGIGSIGGSFRTGSILLRNLPIEIMYGIALGKGTDVNDLKTGLLSVEVDDPDIYLHITGKKLNAPPSSKGSRLEFADWIKNNTYCYSLSVPEKLDSLKFGIMLENLNSYFGNLYNIEGLIEKRKTKYLALVKTSQEDKISTKGGSLIDQVDKFSIKLTSVSLSRLVLALSIPLQKHPRIIDETNHKGKIDIELNCSLSDLDSVNAELKKYNLQMIEKEAIMNTPVIRAKNNLLVK